MNKSRRDDSDAPRSQSLDKLDNFWIDMNEATAMRPVAKAQIYSVKRKLTSKPSRSNMRRPWSTWKNSSKKKRKCEVAEKVQRNCKLLLYWMCIMFFRSLTTDIYSLALSSPNRSRQTLLDPKEKTILKINYLKYYNRIIKIFVESGSSSPSLTSSATLYRPSTRLD